MSGRRLDHHHRVGPGVLAPLGRAGHPVEVAAAFVFFASDEASYVSGTVLGVTGGKPTF